MKRYTLNKHQRVKKKADIEKLFKSKTAIFHYPIIFKWVYTPDAPTPNIAPLRVAVAVPRKKIKKPVQRNTIKRRLREAFRLNKIPVEETLRKANHQCDVLLLYIAKKCLPYDKIEAAVRAGLEALHKAVEKPEHPSTEQ